MNRRKLEAVVITINLLLGGLLWFLACTDFAIADARLNYFFPLLVGLIGLLSVFVLRKANRKRKIIGWLLCVPSILGGGLTVVVGILFAMLSPLGVMFAFGEVSHEKCIQAAPSPDHAKTAKVYFRGVGAYAAGNGRIFVRLSYRFLPFLEREVFYLPSSVATGNAAEFLQWKSGNSIYLFEPRKEITIPGMKFHAPAVLALPLGLVRYLTERHERAQAERKLTVPVSDVPMYPGKIEDDESEYRDERRTAHRFFNISGATPEAVAAWYEHALARPPWTVLQVHRSADATSSGERISYCIKVQRDQGSTHIAYFWEVLGGPGAKSVHVNIGSPHPITEICE